MSWNEPNIKRYEASAFIKTSEYTDAEDVFSSLRHAMDDAPYSFETENNFYKYSDEKTFKVTIIIEQD